MLCFFIKAFERALNYMKPSLTMPKGVAKAKNIRTCLKFRSGWKISRIILFLQASKISKLIIGSKSFGFSQQGCHRLWLLDTLHQNHWNTVRILQMEPSMNIIEKLFGYVQRYKVGKVKKKWEKTRQGMAKSHEKGSDEKQDLAFCYW